MQKRIWTDLSRIFSPSCQAVPIDFPQLLFHQLFAKQNPQDAASVLSDFEEAKQRLSRIADSLQPCDHPYLKAPGYRKMLFQTHRYFTLCRIEDDLVIVDNIFHELQADKNRIR